MQGDIYRRARTLIALAVLCLGMQSGPVRGLASGLLAPHSVGDSSSPSSAFAWIPLTGATVPGGTVDAIAVAPSGPDRLYSLLAGPQGERLYRSDNAALNWQAVYTFTAAVTQLAVDPTFTSTVYAGAPDGLFRSIDDGLHWTQVYTLGQQIVVVSPTLLYVGGPIGPQGPGCPGGQLGVAGSSDGGVSWHLHAIACGLTLTGLAASATRPDVVFASHYYSPTVERSDDGGQTWHGVLSGGDDKFGYVTSLLLDSADPARVYAADIYGVLVSPAEGQTWQRSLNVPCCSGALLAVSGGRVYAMPGLKSGPPYTVYRSDDGGQTWWSALQQLPAAPNVLVADPIDAERLYASPWQYGIFNSTTGGGSWAETNNGIQTPAPIPALDISSHGDVIYAAVGKPRGGMYHTNNGGMTWTLALTGTAPVAVAVDPINPDRAFAAPGTGVIETQDGQTWLPEVTKPIPDVQVDAIAISAMDPEHPHFGGTIPRQGVVLEREPDQIFWPVRSLTDTWNVRALAIDPNNPATLYAGTDGGVKYASFFRSADHGVTWQWKDWGGPYAGVNAMALDTVQTGIIYASASDEEGVFRSDDHGDHWHAFTNGLPTASPSAFALVVDELGTPYAATYNGVYRWDLAQGQWWPFGLQGRWVWSLVIAHGAPEIMLAGTDMGIYEIGLPRWQAWLPIAAR